MIKESISQPELAVTEVTNGEHTRKVKLGSGYAIYSREVCGRETVSIFGREPFSKRIGFRGSIQLRGPNGQ